MFQLMPRKKIKYSKLLIHYQHIIINKHTLTSASNDSIVRNLDSVIKLSKRLSDIQSLDVSINSASLDACIL